MHLDRRELTPGLALPLLRLCRLGATPRDHPMPLLLRAGLRRSLRLRDLAGVRNPWQQDHDFDAARYIRVAP